MTDSLPIDVYLADITSALSESNQLILQAEPGAGKSTRVPLHLLQSGVFHGRITLLEPRRLAARSIARYLASLLGEKVGETVGYRVKNDTRVSAATRLEIVTEGVLLRRLQNDPELEGTSLVIFDEFHERSLQNDLAFSLSLYVQEILRDDLKLLVMSATLDTKLLSRILPTASIIQCEGRSFPVKSFYQPRPDKYRLLDEICSTVTRAVKDNPGDVLVFLPGVGEILRLKGILLGAGLSDDIAIYPLYGALPAKDQDLAIRPSEKGSRKIVLATNIAETSLTIEGVQIVVDSGLQRTARFNAPSGMTRLVTEQISLASAVQRRGRAGRVSEGVCFHMWSSEQHQQLVEHPAEDILIADLSSLALELASWNITDLDELKWVTRPPESHLAQARDILKQLDLLDDDLRVTPGGQQALKMPLQPRLAHMIIQAEHWHLLPMAVDLAVLLSEKDIFESKHHRSLVDRLLVLQGYRQNGQSALSAYPVNQSRLNNALSESKRLLSQVMISTDSTPKSISESELQIAAGRLLAQAYPDRVGRLRSNSDSKYLLRNGKGAVLKQSRLSPAEPWIVAADLDGDQRESLVYAYAPLDNAFLNTDFSAQLETSDNVIWDTDNNRLVAEQVSKLGAITVDVKRLSNPETTLVSQAILDAVVSSDLSILPWTKTLNSWLARARWLSGFNENWPDLSEHSLCEKSHVWLLPYMAGARSPAQIDLKSALTNLLDWQQQQDLELQAPVNYRLPSGNNCRVEYRPDQGPVISVILQELFGVAETPKIAWGQMPLIVELLSPARRPIQITSDLKGFWQTSYVDVCKDMKGQYPKHRWPDDPTVEPPGRSIKRK